jgi:hypothetical protein
MFITDPKKFAEWFNMTHPDAYCQITVEDLENLKACELIHRYGFYSTSQDGKTVMGILKYEQMREKTIGRGVATVGGVFTCKRCGQPLPVPSQKKRGRHKEYCCSCESSRVKERYRKWRKKKLIASA